MQWQDGSCSPTDTVLAFSAIRDRFVGCLHPDDRSQQYTTGGTPALCTLYWEIPINPKQCTDCESKSGNPRNVGNPIDPISFVKRQLEVDYVGNGPHPLRFQRLYLSRAYNVDGKTWRHNYSSAINHQTFGTVPVALAHRANGRTFSFVFNGSAYVPGTHLGAAGGAVDGGRGARGASHRQPVGGVQQPG